MLRRASPALEIGCILLLLLVGITIDSSAAIDCFQCVSMNGSNADCDDPFHNNGSLAFLESPCLGGRKGRDGLFPATACVKIAGIYYDTGISLTVRTCALDSGTLTTDSELIRMSHCGGFYYEGRYLKGCVQSCSDADACNAATRRADREGSRTLIAMATLFALATERFLLSTLYCYILESKQFFNNSL